MMSSSLGRSASLGILTNGHQDRPLSKTGSRSRPQCYSNAFEVAYREVAQQRNFKRLEALFIEADADGSGEMSLDEFRGALRNPWFQRSFSLLGVQPHQAEVVFKSMNNSSNSGEISIQAFMAGLENLVGADLDGPPSDLDVQNLRPSNRTKVRLLALNAAKVGTLGRTASFPSGQSTLSATNLMSPAGTGRLAVSKSGSMSTLSAAGFANTNEQEPGIFFNDRQTFLHTACAKSLHSAIAHSAFTERRPASKVVCHA